MLFSYIPLIIRGRKMLIGLIFLFIASTKAFITCATNNDCPNTAFCAANNRCSIVNCSACPNGANGGLAVDHTCLCFTDCANTTVGWGCDFATSCPTLCVSLICLFVGEQLGNCSSEEQGTCSYDLRSCNPFQEVCLGTNGQPLTPCATPAPTSAPTTNAPTESPTSEPTTAPPTVAPTESPTLEIPTKSPTVAPSESPTVAPVDAPTGSPAPTIEGQCQFCTFTQDEWAEPVCNQSLFNTTCAALIADWSNSGASCIRILCAPLPFVMGNLSLSGFEVAITSSSKIESYLPETGPVGVFNESLVNPITTSAGVFGGNLLAAMINVRFRNISLLAFSVDCSLVASIIRSHTVSEIIYIANQVIANQNSTEWDAFLPEDLNTALALYNSAFDRCENNNPDCFVCNVSTTAPTEAPTVEPTESPTELPTESPTEAPTSESPTESPTTTAPTEAPTESPTPEEPTGSPTVVPTENPTVSPTEAPTIKPTESPTSEEPTGAPTIVPTESPTIAPTETPTLEPSESPTLEVPTEERTDSPTVEPTESPTFEEPTNAPTPEAPTDSPTPSPTSETPTNAPPSVPTPSPTQETPTPVVPTESPTTSPTSEPTTVAPTESPTNAPSLGETGPPPSPTPQPTTQNPTQQPTNAPTIFTSPAPTGAPTSRAPTRTPTESTGEPQPPPPQGSTETWFLFIYIGGAILLIIILILVAKYRGRKRCNTSPAYHKL